MRTILWFRRAVLVIAPLFLATMAFFIVVGPRVLDTSNIAWLSQGDPSTHYLGWLFYRNSGWSFPIGMNPNYGLEISNSILFSDSNPLLAILFKPFDALLPETFQYFGLWIYACFMLQAWVAWKLTGLISKTYVVRFFATGIFVFSPPMIARLGVHFSLGGHFLILAALYLSLRPAQDKRAALWLALLVSAAFVHSYLLIMVSLLWGTNLINLLLKKNYPFVYGLREFFLNTLIVGIVCWQVGYFSVGSGAISGGYGFFRMNLLSIVDPSGWSYVLRDIPEGKGDYEGFNFLGLGVILLGIFAFAALLNGRVDITRAMRNHFVLLLAMMVLTIFALSNKIGVATWEWVMVPDRWVLVANVFRSSGRMFWPVFYMLVVVIIWVIVRSYNIRVAGGLMVVAFVVQVVDTSAGWQSARKKWMAEPASEWEIPLKDPFWTKAASKYRKVRWIMPNSESPNWQLLATYAVKYELGTDAVYLARVGSKQLELARAQAHVALTTGRYADDSLYVIDPKMLSVAVKNIDPTVDLLALIDGFYVVAPGWKKCQACSHVVTELKTTDILPPLGAGMMVRFNENGVGPAYLASGWSEPEPWGVWSDGDEASLVLPISPLERNPQVLLLEANALIAHTHIEQRVEIWVNDVLATAVTLTQYSDNQIRIVIPKTVQNELKDSNYLNLKLKFADAIRPSEIDLSRDTRKLALGLISITVQ